jgi:hypothetical protein
MLFNNVIQYVKYSTVGLTVMTSYLFPESRKKCLGIISILLFNHIVEKISKKIYDKYMTRIERNSNSMYLSLYFHVAIVNKLCCMKYISSNIPTIQFNNYNFPLSVSYELLNIFWKTYSHIIYISYVSATVCCISTYLMYPLIKNYLLNLIDDASSNANNIINRYLPVIENFLNSTIENNNRARIERNIITLEKLNELCPLKCAGLNNVEICDLDECCICKEKFNNNELHRKLPCNHTYHAHCIEDWIIRNKKCPICRYELEV